MGKAMVLEHLGDGQYRIGYYRDVAWAKKRIAECQAIVEQTEKARYKLYTERDNLLGEITGVDTDFKNALSDWAVCAATVGCNAAAKMAVVTPLATKLIELRAKLSGIESQIAAQEALALDAIYEVGFLNSTAAESEEMTVWALDYPPDDTPLAPGTWVGTVETYGVRQASADSDVYLPDPHVNIQLHAEAAFSCARDRRVLPFSCMGVGTATMNALQFRNAVTNNPLHVAGKVVSRNTKTNRLTVRSYFDTPTSGPFYGQEPVLFEDVPVNAGACGAGLFYPGDWVVVKFSGLTRANPFVIGFAEKPRKCAYLTITYTVDLPGRIIGLNPQQIPQGGNGYPVVVASCDNTKGMAVWSDNLTGCTRSETNVQSSATLHATLDQSTPANPYYYYDSFFTGYTDSSPWIRQEQSPWRSAGTAMDGGELVVENLYPGTRVIEQLDAWTTRTTYTWSGETSDQTAEKYGVPVLRSAMYLVIPEPQSGLFSPANKMVYDAMGDLDRVTGWFSSTSVYGLPIVAFVKLLADTTSDTSLGKNAFQQQMYHFGKVNAQRSVDTDVVFGTKTNAITGEVEQICTGQSVVYECTRWQAWAAHFFPAMLTKMVEATFPQYDVLTLSAKNTCQLYYTTYIHDPGDGVEWSSTPGYSILIKLQMACQGPKTVAQKVYNVIGY